MPSRRCGLDAESALANWARWCNDKSGIYPSTPTNWQLIDDVQYKNCYMTEEEKEAEAERHRPVREREAERVELWVSQFDPLYRQALRTHWVEMDERDRLEWHCDTETWRARQASWTQGKLRQLGCARKVDVDCYEAAVNEATRQVTASILIWARGV